MARGRKPILINARELQAEIQKLEETQTFANRTELWAAIELTSWAQAQTPRPLKGQVAMLKAREFNLTIKTPIGKRGREKGCAPVLGGGRRKRKIDANSLTALRNGIPKENREKLRTALERVANGSMKAAVKLKCLDCTNWTPGEVATCEMKECSLWNFRPFKRPSVVKELL